MRLIQTINPVVNIIPGNMKTNIIAHVNADDAVIPSSIGSAIEGPFMVGMPDS